MWALPVMKLSYTTHLTEHFGFQVAWMDDTAAAEMETKETHIYRAILM